MWVPGLYFTEKHTEIIFSGDPSLYQCTPLLPLFSSHSRKVTLLSRLLENLSWKIIILFRICSWPTDCWNIFHEYFAFNQYTALSFKLLFFYRCCNSMVGGRLLLYCFTVIPVYCFVSCSPGSSWHISPDGAVPGTSWARRGGPEQPLRTPWRTSPGWRSGPEQGKLQFYERRERDPWRKTKLTKLWISVTPLQSLVKSLSKDPLCIDCTV